MACSYSQDGVFRTINSSIQVFDFIEDQGKFVPFTCTQCSEAWCAKVCPVDAIKADGETGAKVVFNDKCVGCKVCTMACPFGTITFNSDTGKVQKCDLCDGNPACVEACPTDALTFIPDNATGYDKMRHWAAATAQGATQAAAAGE